MCEHTDEKYYSRGLCKNCYHKCGRIKLATDCEHTDRKLYARKVCKGCYLKKFFRQKLKLLPPSERELKEKSRKMDK